MSVSGPAFFQSEGVADFVNIDGWCLHGHSQDETICGTSDPGSAPSTVTQLREERGQWFELAAKKE